MIERNEKIYFNDKKKKKNAEKCRLESDDCYCSNAYYVIQFMTFFICFLRIRPYIILIGIHK